jgi:hypothetical protein
MPASSKRMSRALTGYYSSDDDALLLTLSAFYREEFLKCQRCLEEQREYFSARAVEDLERALLRIMDRLDRLCVSADAGAVVSQLLRQFDVVAGQTAWSDPRQVH